MLSVYACKLEPMEQKRQNQSMELVSRQLNYLLLDLLMVIWKKWNGLECLEVVIMMVRVTQ